jgi:hypothetical protein
VTPKIKIYLEDQSLRATDRKQYVDDIREYLSRSKNPRLSKAEVDPEVSSILELLRQITRDPNATEWYKLSPRPRDSPERMRIPYDHIPLLVVDSDGLDADWVLRMLLKHSNHDGSSFTLTDDKRDHTNNVLHDFARHWMDSRKVKGDFWLVVQNPNYEAHKYTGLKSTLTDGEQRFIDKHNLIGRAVLRSLYSVSDNQDIDPTEKSIAELSNLGKMSYEKILDEGIRSGHRESYYIRKGWVRHDSLMKKVCEKRPVEEKSILHLDLQISKFRVRGSGKPDHRGRRRKQRRY